MIDLAAEAAKTREWWERRAEEARERLSAEELAALDAYEAPDPAENYKARAWDLTALRTTRVPDYMTEFEAWTGRSEHINDHNA